MTNRGLSVPILLLCLVVLLAGCGGGSPGGQLDTSVVKNSARISAPGDQPRKNPDPRFAPGDKVKVVVFGEENLTGEYQVDARGFITLPLAGSIKAGGLNKPELEKSITKQLQRADIRFPRVTVEETNFRPFFVLGEVNKPGEYPYRAGLNVLSAVAIAGGATYRANKSKIFIQRSGSSELTKYPFSHTVRVMPGDVVKVPERYF